MIENYIDKIAGLLTDRSHGVLVGGLTLLIEICGAMPSVIPTFRKLSTQLIRMLKNLVLSGYAPEHDVSGITDPFLQCRILHTLRVLGAGDKEVSEGMSDILAQVATNTESSKNAGVAILYECVRTILGIEADTSLRVLGINTLCKFLVNRDNNIRYVALNTLTKVAPGDLKSIQRHRGTIVDCLRDPDISIRRRALDLVSLLVNDTNVKPLIKELLGYLTTADAEFKEDLTSKICRVVSKHAPSRRFQTNTIMQVLIDAGEFVLDDISNTLPSFIASDTLLQAHAVHTLFRALEKSQGSTSLCLASIWCIGEFGEHLAHPTTAHEDDAALEPVQMTRVTTVMSNLLESSLQPSLVKIYTLTAVLKLSSRYPSHKSQFGSILERHHSSIVVEMQQRSSEYSMLLQLEPTLLKELVDHMPTTDDEAASQGDARGSSQPAAAVQGSASAADDLLNLLDDMSMPSGGAGGVGGGMPAVTGGGQAMSDLLGDVFGGPAPTTSSAPTGAGSAPSMTGGGVGGIDLLGDMLGGGPSVASPAAPSAAPQLGGGGGGGIGGVSGGGGAPTGNHQMMAYDKNGILAKMELVKHPVNKQLTQINTSFTNSNPTPVENFTFQVIQSPTSPLLLTREFHFSGPGKSATCLCQLCCSDWHTCLQLSTRPLSPSAGGRSQARKVADQSSVVHYHSSKQLWDCDADLPHIQSDA